MTTPGTVVAGIPYSRGLPERDGPIGGPAWSIANASFSLRGLLYFVGEGPSLVA